MACFSLASLQISSWTLRWAASPLICLESSGDVLDKAGRPSDALATLCNAPAAPRENGGRPDQTHSPFDVSRNLPHGLPHVRLSSTKLYPPLMTVHDLGYPAHLSVCIRGAEQCGMPDRDAANLKDPVQQMTLFHIGIGRIGRTLSSAGSDWPKSHCGASVLVPRHRVLSQARAATTGERPVSLVSQGSPCGHFNAGFAPGRPDEDRMPYERV